MKTFCQHLKAVSGSYYYRCWQISQPPKFPIRRNKNKLSVIIIVKSTRSLICSWGRAQLSPGRSYACATSPCATSPCATRTPSAMRENNFYLAWLLWILSSYGIIFCRSYVESTKMGEFLESCSASTFVDGNLLRVDHSTARTGRLMSTLHGIFIFLKSIKTHLRDHGNNLG